VGGSSATAAGPPAPSVPVDPPIVLCLHNGVHLVRDKRTKRPAETVLYVVEMMQDVRCRVALLNEEMTRLQVILEFLVNSAEEAGDDVSEEESDL